jgi:hypothetical protein
VQIQSKFLIGYKAASEFTGLPVRRIRRMVESRQIRVLKPNSQVVMFVPERLTEDLLATEVPKL